MRILISDSHAGFMLPEYILDQIEENDSDLFVYRNERVIDLLSKNTEDLASFVRMNGGRANLYNMMEEGKIYRFEDSFVYTETRKECYVLRAVEVDTKRKWAIGEYDGWEFILYIKEVDDVTGYCELIPSRTHD